MSNVSYKSSSKELIVQLDHKNAQRLYAQMSFLINHQTQRDHRLKLQYTSGGKFKLIFKSRRASSTFERAKRIFNTFLIKLTGEHVQPSCSIFDSVPNAPKQVPNLEFYSKTTGEVKLPIKKKFSINKLPTELIKMVLQKLSVDNSKRHSKTSKDFSALLPLRCVNKRVKTIIECIIPPKSIDKGSCLVFNIEPSESRLFIKLENAQISPSRRPQINLPVTLDIVEECARFIDTVEHIQMYFCDNNQTFMTPEQKEKTWTNWEQNKKMFKSLVDILIPHDRFVSADPIALTFYRGRCTFAIVYLKTVITKIDNEKVVSTNCSYN